MTDFSAAQLATLLISSSVLAALVSIAGNHLLAQLQFKRDYYKEVIAKRLNAYQQIDELIGILRGTTYDDSGRVVHMLFMNRAIHDRATLLTAIGVGLGLYLSEEVRGCLSEINLLMLKLPSQASQKEAFEIGVANRELLLKLRQRLDFLVAADLLSLYKVRKFLRAKQHLASQPETGYLAKLPRHGGYSFGGPNAEP